jgi:transcriptional regulator with XRE-family HTH domain
MTEPTRCYSTDNPFARWLRGERRVRLYRGHALTQMDVAKQTGIPYRSYARIERGEQIPTYIQMAAISRFFRVNEDWLWMEANHLPPDMYQFLVNTQQGEVLVRNIRRIMEQVESEGGATERVATYPENERMDQRDRLRFFSALDVAEHQPAIIRHAFPQRQSS